MASMPQTMSYTLGASAKKNIAIPSCIAQLHKKKRQFIKPTLLSPNALVGQRKPMRDLNEKLQNEKWKTRCSSMDDGSSGVDPYGEFPTPPSVLLVQDFYEAFNGKDSQRLDQLLSPHCVYHDLLFYGPYDGKESLLNFLRIAMDALGPNVHIRLEDVHESNQFLVTVFWHLEWKTKKIPFTSGCRIFNFEEVEGRLLISKITGLEELPLKPGELVLKLLKTIRTLFDSYPLAAEALLESHAQDDTQHFDLFGRNH